MPHDSRHSEDLALAADSLQAIGCRVLFAMSGADQARFFGEVGSGVHASLHGQRLDPETVEDSRALVELNPEVLVSAWSTPPLPGDWLGRPDCRLRYVCHVTGSVRKLVPRFFLERGGLVTNWGGAAAGGVAEHALLLILASLREAARWPDALSSAPALRSLRTRRLAGRRVGLHGFGGIARKLVELLRPFGVELRAFSHGVPESVMETHGVRPAAGVAELFAWSEVLVECEALTPSTAGSVNGELLQLLPDDAVFVNVGRGRVVDEPALIELARTGRVRVAVDVLQDEPATTASTLCLIPGVLVSPHIGGPTVEEYENLGAAALENLRRYANGQPLRDVVTLEIYDRST